MNPICENELPSLTPCMRRKYMMSQELHTNTLLVFLSLIIKWHLSKKNRSAYHTLYTYKDKCTPEKFQTSALTPISPSSAKSKLSLSPSLLSLTAPPSSLFLSTPKLHSHCLALPPELCYRTSPVLARLAFVSLKNPQNRIFFLLLPTPDNGSFFLASITWSPKKVFLSLLFYIFHILFICFFFSCQSFYDDWFGSIISPYKGSTFYNQNSPER